MADVPSMDKLAELLWQHAFRQLESTNNEVLLPVNITEIIGQENVDMIKARLSAHIDAPVVAFIDETISAFRVMRTPAFSGTVKTLATHDRMSLERRSLDGKNAAPAKPAKVPRPPDAFILYRQLRRPRIKEAHPHLSDHEISIILDKQWKSECDDTKQLFRDWAEVLKKLHAEDHPDYRCSP